MISARPSLPHLSQAQRLLVERPLNATIFLEGLAGTGKSTTGVERMLYLMSQGVRADSILLILPQRTLATPYYEALRYPGVVAGGVVTILTIGGLAQRMVDLFWPLIAGQAGFALPSSPPTFLTLETAQYYMAHIVHPLLDQGYFDSVTISRNRLYSQILDNLNKAALVGFPYTEISKRLKSAWVGDIGQARVYEDAQECAIRFRQYCLDHNLLDFSLQLDVFVKHLWHHPLCREYLDRTYHHLIVDNLEEDTPTAHDLLGEWLPHFDSAFLIYDQDAGFRRFLGADPISAYALKDLCIEQVAFSETSVNPPYLITFGRHLLNALNHPATPSDQPPISSAALQTDINAALDFEVRRFYPEMLDWVSNQVASLVHEDGLPAGEIVILAPFLSDALRFSLQRRLDDLSIPSRSHRPSRALREEPAVHCLLTLASLAHPHWFTNGEHPLYPTKYDVAYALLQAISGMDLVRAQLLAEIVYRIRDGSPSLSSFDRIHYETQERITYTLGQRYESLRLWLEEYSRSSVEELDLFLSRLFGELLSQPGYNFHHDFQAGEIAANLIESAQKFRWGVGTTLAEEGKPLGPEYIQMVQDGVVAAQYIYSWQAQPEDAVLLAPAHTYLMSNRSVEVQFWLDISSRSWFERLFQPLTHPYVLSRQWPTGASWTDDDEYQASQDTLFHLALGLLHRCRLRIYLGLSDLNEQGYQDRGTLLRAIQRVLRGASSGQMFRNMP